jgi:hypothetical protein
MKVSVDVDVGGVEEVVEAWARASFVPSVGVESTVAEWLFTTVTG